MQKQSRRGAWLEELRRRIARLEAAADVPLPVRLSPAAAGLGPSAAGDGFSASGTLVEWLSPGEGTGAGTLALLAAREACRTAAGWWSCWTAAASFAPRPPFGWESSRSNCWWSMPAVAADNDWAMDQALRSPAAAAVLAWTGRLDDRTFRRWQLAAEQGGCLGLLLRPAVGAQRTLLGRRAAMGRAAADGMWNRLLASRAFLQLENFAAGRQAVAHTGRPAALRIVVLRCRGGAAGRG